MGNGEIELHDLDALIDAVRKYGASPNYVYIAPDGMRRLLHIEWLSGLDRVHPLPRYKIRACHLRKIHKARQRGRAHIRRVERAERQREEALMREKMKM